MTRRTGVDRSVRLFAIATACLLLVTGCVAQPSYGQLERGAKSTDALPDSIPHTLTKTFEPGSLRLVAHHNGTVYYLAKPKKQAGVCIVMVKSTLDWVSSCGRSELNVDLGTVSVRVMTDPEQTPEHWTRLSKNIAIDAA